MRVIAGQLGGRAFDSPGGHRTHPMSNKVRGAIFNMLGDISNMTVLDPFGGSGAISFEAISRGAKTALIIELDRKAQDAISKNIKALGVGAQAKLVRARVEAWQRSNYEAKFDLILADPPYDGINHKILESLFSNLATGGTLVLSWPDGLEIPLFENSKLVANKKYGDAQLAFYKQLK